MKGISAERMRYQKNSASFWLCISGLVLNVGVMVLVYGARTIVNNYLIGVDIIINICFLLFVFLGSEKTKAYKLDWSYKCFALAGLQVARIFFIPLIFFLKHQLALWRFSLLIIFLAGSALALIAAGLFCYFRSVKLHKFLKEQQSAGKQ